MKSKIAEAVILGYKPVAIMLVDYARKGMAAPVPPNLL